MSRASSGIAASQEMYLYLPARPPSSWFYISAVPFLSLYENQIGRESLRRACPLERRTIKPQNEFN
jgi:hypothetical protein